MNKWPFFITWDDRDDVPSLISVELFALNKIDKEFAVFTISIVYLHIGLVFCWSKHWATWPFA